MVASVPDIEVTDEQIIEFEDEGAEVELENDILEIEAPALTLRVTDNDDDTFEVGRLE